MVSGRNLNSSKLSFMSLLPARMKMIQLNMKELEWSQNYSHYKSMGMFPDAKRQLTRHSKVRTGQILELVRDVIVVLITSKNEENLIKNEGVSLTLN